MAQTYMARGRDAVRPADRDCDGLVLAGLAFGWHEHRLGEFAQLKKTLKKTRSRCGGAAGGQDVVQLQRSQMLEGNVPEFLSATLLPGRGMNLLQITAYLPQKGEVNLLASPTLEEAARLLTGAGGTRPGHRAWQWELRSRCRGRAEFWVATPDGGSLLTVWRGERLTLPTYAKDSYGVGGAMAAGDCC